jgi:hypothetical protein
MEKLMKMRNAAEKLLRIEMKNSPSVEKRYRISKILEMPVNRPKISDTDYRRLLRSIYALEIIRTSRAKGILKSLSEGHPHFDISGEATDALVRISQFENAQSN